MLRWIDPIPRFASGNLMPPIFLSSFSSYVTRRRFGFLMTAAAVLLGSSHREGVSTSTGDAATRPVPVPLLTDGFRALTPYEATVLDEVTALIIPTDQDPGAREARIVMDLDRSADHDPNELFVYRQGIAWLDLQSADLFEAETFLLLDRPRREHILNLADESLTVRQKIREWWQFGRIGVGRQFFELVKHRTFQTFYASPMGWRVVGYQGPPQFGGHADYSRCA